VFDEISPVNVYATGGLTGFTIPSVQGGSPTNGSLSVSGFGQTQIDNVSVVSSNPALVSVPATVSINELDPLPFQFPITTSVVTTTTTVPVTASLNGSSITVNLILTPTAAPVLKTFTLTNEVVEGGAFDGKLTFSKAPAGSTIAITLVSDNPTLVPVPGTVTLAVGKTSVSFTGMSALSSGLAHVTASYNGVSLTDPISVDSVPPATITLAEYRTISQVLKINATTTIPKSTLSFGTDPNLPPIDKMQFSGGVWSASYTTKTVPTQATVFNSNGGSVTSQVTLVMK
jgi:hypothetical protein